MDTLEGNFFKRLLERDVELRRVYEAHRSCDKKIAKLGKKAYLTRAEEVEEKRLKKLKLLQKDRMEEIILRYREGRG